MSLWTDLEADAAAIMEQDGEAVKITTATQTCYVRVFWQEIGLEGGEQSGPMFWCASDDLPSDFTQGNTVTRGTTTYVISHRDPDGHGLDRITVDDDR